MATKDLPLKTAYNIRTDLSQEAKKLILIITEAIKSRRFQPGHPETFLGYKECCDRLGLTTPEMDVHWGRLLQQHGLDDLNAWTIRYELPRVSGLIVNQEGERKYLPGGDYFSSNGRPNFDFIWWDGQVSRSLKFDWSKVI